MSPAARESLERQAHDRQVRQLQERLREFHRERARYTDKNHTYWELTEQIRVIGWVLRDLLGEIPWVCEVPHPPKDKELKR